jgi:hypothetical protein
MATGTNQALVDEAKGKVNEKLRVPQKGIRSFPPTSRASDFPSKVRESCGLFVAMLDSQIADFYY